jgi:hypothetical protein
MDRGISDPNFFPSTIYEKSVKFSHFIIDILESSDSYYELFELGISKEEFDLYEAEFRGFIEKIY